MHILSVIVKKIIEIIKLNSVALNSVWLQK